MIDTQTVLDSQRDLAALCADRAPSGVEHFLPNENYGIARLLKLYSGYPLGRPLPAVIPHGAYLSDTYLAPAEADALLPAVLNYPAYRDVLWETGTDKIVIPCASPFLYALKLAPPEPGIERQGTLLFPAHSTRYFDIAMNWAGLAEKASNLPDKMQPVSVCVYFTDLRDGKDRPFRERGMPVYCAGHIYDDEFMFRLVRLLQLHRYGAGNGLGGNVFFAVAAGCRYKYIRQSAGITGVGAKEGCQYSPAQSQFMYHVMDLLSGDPDASYEEISGIAARMLRTDAVLSPGDLKSRLLQARRTDLTGVRGRGPGGPVWTSPYALRRAARGAGELRKRAVRKATRLLRGRE